MGSPFPYARGVPKQYIKGQPYNKTADQEHRWTVPDDKIWWLLSCSMKPSNSSTVTMKTLNKDATETVDLFLYNSATTAQQYGPEVTAGQTPPTQVVAYENQIIDAVFGSAQSTGTSKIFIKVIEYDLEEVLKGP